MKIIERGNTNIMKSIAQKAKQVSEHNGLAENKVFQGEISTPAYEGGAFMSMQRRKAEQEKKVKSTNNRIIAGTPTPLYSKGSEVSTAHESVFEKRLNERLLESVETLGVTKEYFNAVSSLFTLYSMDKLTEGVLNSVGEEDMREIKGIIREFKSMLDRY